MPKEIERKFLVSHIPDGLLETKIKQGYLQSEKHRTVRIRIVNDNSSNETAYLTIKGKSNSAGTSRYEFELQIPIKEAIYLIEMYLGYVIVLGIPFVLTLTYVVFFPGLASFIFWIKGISLIGANRAGVFLHLMPIFGAIMAMVIFDEKFMYYHIFGAIFIIAGIIISNKKRKND